MPKFKIDKPIRLIELFAGVGSQAMALRDLGADFEHYRVIEFDRFAVASYNAIHGTNFTPTDICEVGGKLGIVDTDKYTYILTYSFPCQDLSLAGKGRGMSKGTGTRSGLLWEVERILNETEELPQVLLMENVPEVKSANNKDDFHAWQDFLTRKGYTNYVDVLNAKNFGVAQNRERCFMVSILGEYNYKFPQSIPLTKTVNDYLEDAVDEKYYINSEKAMSLIKDLEERGGLSGARTNKIQDVGFVDRGDGKKHQSNTVYNPNGIARTLYAGDSKDPMRIVTRQVGNIAGNQESFGGNPQTGRVYGPDGLRPTLNTMQGGGREPKFIVEHRADEGLRTFKDGTCGTIRSEKESGGDKRVIVASRGRNKENPNDWTVGADVEQRLEIQQDNISNTLTSVQKDNMILETAPSGIYQSGHGYNNGGLKELVPTLTSNSWQENNFAVTERTQYRLRKLIPLECWRLMDFMDEDFYKAQAVCSNSQLYKQAGNSIVKAVLMAIFKQML